MTGMLPVDSGPMSMIGAILVPAIAALGIALLRRWPNLREAVTLIASLALFLVVLRVAWLFGAEGGIPSVTLMHWTPELGLKLSAEPLGVLFALVASFLWIVNSVYSIGYMRGNGEAHQTRFYVCFALAIASTMWIAFAGNLLTLFFGYEALTLSTYPLVTHSGKPEAVRGGRTYLGILLATSIGMLLLAIVIIWRIAGTLDFVPGGVLTGLPEGPVDGRMIGLLLFLFMFGIGKAALMPVHRWLPAAMVAPTPVSALLHAVAVVKAGVFSIVKVVVYVFGIDLLAATPEAGWLLYVAGFTIVAASVIALRQDNLKRRLAYSTVSQLSYVIMATAILVPISIAGAALHIAAHAFGKITLFFAAGSIYTAAHKTEVSQLNGIGRRMPWTMTAFAVGALSMIGVPPTAGFISKWFILQGALTSGQFFAVTVIAVSTLLNAAYLLPVVHAAFFKAPDGPQQAAHGEAPLPIVLALVVTAAGTVLLFFVPDVVLDLAMQLAEQQ